MNNILKLLFLFLIIVLLSSKYITKINLADYKTKSINVCITGQVINEKCITLPAYSTISDALKWVEVTRNADLTNLNQQIILKDKDVIVVPERSVVLKVSINTATKEELMTLEGIGESIAQRIIDYRNTNGLFQTLEQLMEVKGIKEKTFEKIKEYICL